MKGILLIATSHPYYGRLAATLAMSIKAVEDIPIAVIADDVALRHLNEAELALFSQIIPAPVGESGLIGINALRMNLPKYSPFKETLSMDVDMLWHPKRKPSEAFALLDGRDFTIVNEGYVDLDTGADHTTGKYSHWAAPEAIKEAFGLSGKLYQTRGEFLLFRKSPEVTELYKSARAIQKKPGIDTMLLGGSVTDEFALNIAMNKAGIEPHESKWNPAYWPAIHGNIVPPVYKLTDYLAVSFGGNVATKDTIRIYSIIAGAAAYNLGLQHRFPLQSKRNYLTERRSN